MKIRLYRFTLSTAFMAALYSPVVNAKVSTSIVPQLTSSLCAEPNLHCAHGTNGIVIGKTEELGHYAAVIDEAATKFQKHFDIKASLAAVVLGGSVSDKAKTTLKNEMYRNILPWLSQTDKKKLIHSSIRSQLQEQMPGAMEEQIENILAAKMKEIDDGKSNSEATQIEYSALAHELAHYWFIDGYWKEDAAALSNFEGYGGPAPDWLDETAAVLAENEALTRSRRQQLIEKFRENSTDAIWPLTDYFNMEHPRLDLVKQQKALKRQRKDKSTQTTAIFMTADEVKERAKENNSRAAGNFYLQSRGFADFMIETTGNERIFAKIARFIANGGSMADWLKSEGSQQGLPASIEALEALWLSWLPSRITNL